MKHGPSRASARSSPAQGGRPPAPSAGEEGGAAAPGPAEGDAEPEGGGAPEPSAATTASGLAPETEDALVALIAVRDGLVTEAQVERARARQQKGPPGRALLRALVETGALSTAARAELVGRLDPYVVPGYRIDAEAGRGGMGVVYRAHQLSMDRAVAIKVLSRRLSGDAGYVEKFLAEARSAAKLNHEHVVAAIDAGAAAGLHYFVMELIDGPSTADLLERDGPLPWPRAFEVAEQVARALEHAHAAGLVHRDVKPENVMIAADGRAKLCDLGLAKPTAVAGTGERSEMTEGTPYYCSPEQATGRTDIDARSDVYSLGTTLYHLLKGEPPFDGEDARAILVKQVRAPFPDLDLALPEVPAPLRALLADMVVKDREGRLPSARAFLDRMAQARRALAPSAGAGAAPAPSGGARRAPPLGALAAAAAVLLVAGGAWIGVRGRSDPQAGGQPADGETDAGTSPATPDGPAPTPRPRPPRVTRVDPLVPGPGAGAQGGEPARDPGATPAAAGDAASASPADAALAQARAYLLERPEDWAGGRARLRAVVERHDGTEAASAARRALDALETAALRAGVEAFQGLTDRVVAHAKEGRFAEAEAALDAFDAEWAPVAVRGLTDQTANLRAGLLRQAEQRLVEVEARLAGGQDAAARADLAALAERLPAEVARKARARLDALAADEARRAAEALWAAARAERDAALRRGDLAAARAAVERARDDARAAPLRADVDRALLDLGEVARAGAAFEAACRRLADDEHRLRTRAGEALRGRLVSFDPVTLRGEWKPHNLRDPVPLDLRDLHPDDLLGLALPLPEGWRANALWFLTRDLPDLAATALDANLARGGADDAGLRAEVARVRAGLVEREAEALVARILAAGAAADEVVRAAREATPALAAAPAWRARFAEVREAFLRARAEQLAAGPAALLRGQVEVSRRGEDVTVRYDWKDRAQLEDWTLDEQVQGSRVTLQEGAGVVVRGRLVHAATFQGGALAVELKVEPRSADRPNVNLVLGDRGRWTGTLVGLGFKHGNQGALRVEPTAPRKPGWNVPLPAHVIATLSGQAPQRDGANHAADPEPSLAAAVGKPQRVEVARSKDGAVRVRLRGRNLLEVPPVPEWDAPGAVSLLPLESELLVVSIELTGRLDPAWTQARAAALAQRDVDALPAPR